MNKKTGDDFIHQPQCLFPSALCTIESIGSISKEGLFFNGFFSFCVAACVVRRQVRQPIMLLYAQDAYEMSAQ